MNKLKSLFITTYIVLLLIGVNIGIIHLIGNVSEVMYLAGLLICFLPLSYFYIIYVLKPKQVGGIITIITALIGTTFLIGLGRIVFESQGVGPIFIFSLISLLGWIAYLTWYSKYQGRNIQHLVGEKLSQLNFTNQDGQPVSISADRHDYYLMLFHRGNWCPFCMTQIRKMVIKYQELSSRNVQVNIISTVNEEWSTKIANKYAVDMNFLIDKDLEIAKRLDIVEEDGLPFGLQLLGFKSDTILPTVLLLDKNLKVLFIHETDDNKKRPEPEFFIRLIDSYN